ncbi:MAG: carbohydrate ABC transporter permease [Propionibacteriaceae bacterium]|jgi:alpha-glucoside transport system permease protein|nr:carbohydrate ABC transporter permease [Propionibacteriaceae bacterium]
MSTLTAVSASHRPHRRTHQVLSSPWATAGAIIIAVVWTLPTFGLFLSSFRPADDITTSGWWTFFAHPQVTLSNYAQTLDFTSGISVIKALLNSITITLPAAIIPIVLGLLAAYALAWIDFKGRNILFIAIFALQIVPLQMLLVPLLKLYTGGVSVGGLHLFPGFAANSLSNGFAQVWITHTMSALPLAIFMLHNSLAAIPTSVMEAAQIDGAGHGQVFFRVALPLATPTIASYAIFQFLWVWNDLLVATIFTSGQNAPITKMLSDLSGVYGQQWYLLTAGTFLAIIVPLIVFFALQRFFVRGLLAGSTKG